MEFVQMIGELLGAGGSTVSLHALTPCQLVQHQKDQTVQEQGVEEANGAGHFVGENQTPLQANEGGGWVRQGCSVLLPAGL